MAIAQEYPDVELSHMYVDNASMQLIRDPKQVCSFYLWLCKFMLTNEKLFDGENASVAVSNSEFCSLTPW